MIVVSSMKSGDFRVGEGTSEGVRILRDFLRMPREEVELSRGGR